MHDTPHTITTRQKISKKLTKLSIDDMRSKLADYLNTLRDDPKKVPSIVGYAIYCGVNKTYFYTRAETTPEVQTILDTIHELQEERLLSLGLTGGYNSKMSIFLLSSRHGYNTQANTLVQNNNLNVSADVLADAFRLLEAEKTVK